jgi:hypothetical protein
MSCGCGMKFSGGAKGTKGKTRRGVSKGKKHSKKTRRVRKH